MVDRGNGSFYGLLRAVVDVVLLSHLIAILHALVHSIVDAGKA